MMIRRGPWFWLPVLLPLAACSEAPAPGADGAPAVPDSAAAADLAQAPDRGQDLGIDRGADLTADSGGGPCPPFKPGSDPKLTQLLKLVDAKLSYSAADAKPAGVALAVVLGGKLISAEGRGMRAKTGQPQAGKAVDRQTLFWIASSSKLMTATGAMALVDRSKLDLTTSVTSYLPHYTEANGKQALITLDNLLKMKSGLNNDGGCYIFSQSKSRSPTGCVSMTTPTADHVLGNMFSAASLKLYPWGTYFNKTALGTPGSAPYSYSNWGIMLVGRVMEVGAGKFFPALMQERVFGPAGMCGATYDARRVLAGGNYAVGAGPAAVDGHCPEPELGHDSRAPWLADELACPGRNPNGGVRASAVALGRFAEALLADLGGANRMLSRAAAQQLLSPKSGRATITGGHTVYGDTYGYCNFHHAYRGHQVFSHGGGRPGFGTLLWLVPARNFAVAISSNSGSTTYFQAEAEFALRCYLDGQCS